MSVHLFGTDGIRGKANTPPLTGETAYRLGRAVACQFNARRGGPPILIVRDTRLSGPLLECALAAGVASAGGDVLLGGVLPTPGAAALARRLPAAAAIVVSASHNPFDDNGLKVFQGSGFKCDDGLEDRLAELMTSREIDEVRPTGLGIGRILPFLEAERRFIEVALNEFAPGLNLEGMRIAVDCANGAAYRVTPSVLQSLGATVEVFHAAPDGANINASCGSTHPEEIARLTCECRAQIGISHDGDADRVIFADETGSVLDGDEVLAILALALHAEGRLAGAKLVATVMSNLGLDEAMQAAGIAVVRAQVGDRYVLEKMLAEHLNLGGEQSGHVILADYNTTGDGLNTALQLLRVVRRSGKPLSALRRCMRKYPQLLINEAVREKVEFDAIPGLRAALDAAELELNGAGRILLRYSGTEPKIRLLLEARDGLPLDELAGRILAPVRKCIGV